MNKKRLIVAIVLVIAEIIVMAFIIKLMHPRAYDPVAVGGGVLMLILILKKRKML